MKPSVPFMLLTALIVAGCARPVVRETVVERPVIVDRPSVVAGATLPSCTYASQSYSQGAVSCQDRTQFVCNGGNWERTLNAC
jgi:hypothetical protein